MRRHREPLVAHEPFEQAGDAPRPSDPGAQKERRSVAKGTPSPRRAPLGTEYEADCEGGLSKRFDGGILPDGLPMDRQKKVSRARGSCFARNMSVNLRLEVKRFDNAAPPSRPSPAPHPSREASGTRTNKYCCHRP